MNYLEILKNVMEDFYTYNKLLYKEKIYCSFQEINLIDEVKKIVDLFTISF